MGSFEDDVFLLGLKWDGLRQPVVLAGKAG